ncbi:MAG: hypothetical protein H0X54_08080 [Propionibacteriales bacterium]|nr:hypothetical protein [Propionibacteriales bacterium]
MELAIAGSPHVVGPLGDAPEILVSECATHCQRFDGLDPLGELGEHTFVSRTPICTVCTETREEWRQEILQAFSEDVQVGVVEYGFARMDAPLEGTF